MGFQLLFWEEGDWSEVEGGVVDISWYGRGQEGSGIDVQGDNVRFYFIRLQFFLVFFCLAEFDSKAELGLQSVASSSDHFYDVCFLLLGLLPEQSDLY